MSKRFLIAIFTLIGLNASYCLAEKICVAGAGDTEWDGTYNNDSSEFVYQLDSTHYIVFSDSGWGFFDNTEATGTPAYSSPDNDAPASNTGFTTEGGAAPVPDITSGECVAPSPSPDPSPGVEDPLSQQICVNESDDYSIDAVGTYELTEGASKTEGFLYKKGESYSIRPYFNYKSDSTISFVHVKLLQRASNLSARVLYYNQYVNDIGNIPLGSFESRQEVYLDTACCPFYSVTDPVLITSGPCPESFVRSVPRTIISGKINKIGSYHRSARADSYPEMVPGLYFAFLFEGLTDEDASSKVPVGFAVTNDAGEYEFTKVLPGEYHITFAGIDTTFSPEQVSVTVVGSEGTTAPDTAANTINYSDEGCRVSSLNSELTAINFALVDFLKSVNNQIKELSELAINAIPEGKKQDLIVSRLDTASSRVVNRHGAILELASKFPVQIRTKCPESTECTSQKLIASIGAMRKNVRAMGSTEKRIVKGTRKSFNKKQQQILIKQRSRTVTIAMNKLLKLTNKLPAKHDVCPEE